MKERRAEDRRLVAPWPPLVRWLLVAAGVLCLALSVAAIITSNGVQDLTSRRNVTVDALSVSADQQSCVNRTTAEWQLGITRALLADPRSPEQAAAIEAMRPIAEALETIEQRCFADQPVEPG